MSFELDPGAWERAARAVDELAAGLPEPPDLPLPDDRYARALGDLPQRSDAAARAAHRAAVAELHGLAARIRAGARDVIATDTSGAEQIATAR
ncbi:hypothetical protein [Tsukamurella strandjordii]|uniref:Uncharacterized protein n=1 Tax=Tsukamurella strandjordii TaxID=147577 RepID=A0AA90S8G7_9ACTN|nr:hypothetical protein [Tsukamurella strandjordii]MDP0398870.1 hypothetical protein [Tsukamurella strandjordii]